MRINLYLTPQGKTQFQYDVFFCTKTAMYNSIFLTIIILNHIDFCRGISREDGKSPGIENY